MTFRQNLQESFTYVNYCVLYNYKFGIYSTKGRFTHSMPFPCRAAKGLECVFPIWFGREKAVLCCGLEKNGMVGAWHGHGMASVNLTQSHCVNQMGKTHSKPLAARQGRGTAWARHGNGILCVNRP